MIKKADIFLTVILIAVGIVASFCAASSHSIGDTVLITANGKEYARYSLLENRIVSISQKDHTNEITIKDGEVSMTFSDCKNQVCVNTGKISKTTQSIVCLPNKVMVEIIGKGEPKFDAVSN